MKTIKYIIPLLLVFVISGCKKKDSTDVSKTVKVSYPTITLKGSQYVSIKTGETYADEGAVLTDDISGAKSDITSTSSNVDNTTPGLYFMFYEASNSNGFATKVSRVIVVTNMDDTKDDISGHYQRTSNGADVMVTKLKRGLYMIDNVGGVADPASPAVLPVFMARFDDTTISVPNQPVPNEYGMLDCTSEALRITPDTAFMYIVQNPGFGTSLRTFVKVP